ncbi:hypothetical protein BPA01_42830 [Brevibacillus parabrevis]|uniref:Uncharacterized protein n=1 Tax=Brevibacillus parabrevis TaxID=54914 RepID=A0A4Y3PMR1_BREPA|nr:hypothetical protein BPA01_42830 [Brevibacillus parabrevis]
MFPFESKEKNKATIIPDRIYRPTLNQYLLTREVNAILLSIFSMKMEKGIPTIIKNGTEYVRYISSKLKYEK